MTDVEMSSTARSSRRSRIQKLGCLFGSVVTAVAVVVLPATSSVGANPLGSMRAQAAQINAELNSDAARLDALDQQYQTAQQHVATLQAQVQQAKGALSAAQAQVAADQIELRHQALDAYMSGTSGSDLSSVFSQGGETAAAANEYKTLANGALANAVDNLKLAQLQLSQQQNQYQDAANQANAALAVVASSLRQAQGTLAARQSTLGSINGKIAQLVAADAAAAAAASYNAYLAHLSASHGSNVPAAGGASAAVNAAESQIGVPYEWGAESPGHGFDCSGLTQWSWRQAGVSIPRTAEEQMQAVARVPLADMEPGDLVFWGSGGSASHVAIYIGHGEVVHAPSSGETVRVQQIWNSGLLGAGRP